MRPSRLSPPELIWRGTNPSHAENRRPADLGLDQDRLARLVNAMQSEYILGEIDANRDNIHGLPLSSK